MVSSSRPVLAALFCLALAVGLLAAAPRLPEPLLDRALSLSEEDLDRGACMQGRADRLLAKLEIIDLLQQGELSLLEAAARFQELDRVNPPCKAPPCLVGVSVSPGEHHCREVIHLVRARAHSHPELAALVGRLKKELSSELARSSRIELPID